jgi:meso-butanediol dehydrogenase/(S,S)-butanediol dehydrogenase/diacetyl reductase
MRAATDEAAAVIVAAGGAAHAVEVDVTDRGSVDALVGAAVERFGDLDVMVANAGVVHVGPLLDVTPEELDRVMAVNVRGVFLCWVAAARHMIDRGGGGKLIAAASGVAHRGAALLGPYSASKFAVRGLVQAAAQEWGPHGITVNAYAPGIVEGPMWDYIDERLAEQLGLEPGEAMAKRAQRIALGRVQVPDDVAAFVSYLMSADADYMTGQTALVDGGLNFA